MISIGIDKVIDRCIYFAPPHTSKPSDEDAMVCLFDGEYEMVEKEEI
jgi:hypothetical protein